MLKLASTVWRDFETFGVPASGIHKPVKRDIRAWGAYVESLASAAQVGGAVVFSTKAQASGVLGYPPYQMAWVVNDPTPENNGIYQKSGSSGSGFWTKRIDLPYSFYRATNIGAGTPNAIEATTDNPIANSESLIVFNVTDDNTESPVTLLLNGGAPLTIKTAGGNDPVSGGLTAGMMVAGYIDQGGTQFRMLSDQASTAIQMAAEEAAATAEAARDVATGAMSVFEATVFATLAVAEAYSPAPEMAPDYIRLEGRTAVGDGGGALYKKVVSEPSHGGKFFVTLSDTSTAWFEIAESVLRPQMFGAKGDGEADDSSAFQAAADNLQNNGAVLMVPPGTYKLGSQIVFTGLENFKIIGTDATVISAERILSYFRFDSCTNVSIEGVAFDLGQPVLPTYTSDDYGTDYNTGINVQSCSGVFIQRCTFKNLYTVGINFYATSGVVSVTHCEFSSPTQAQTQSLQHIQALSCGARFDISHNRFVNDEPINAGMAVAAINVSSISGGIAVRYNYFKHCGRDNTGGYRLGVIDFYTDVQNVVVEDNVVDDCWHQFMRLSNCRNGTVRRNRVAVSGQATGYTLLSVESGAFTYTTINSVTDIVIEDNVLLDPYNRHSVAIGLYSYDWGTPLRNVRVARNKCDGAASVVYLLGPYHKVYIEDNIASGYLSRISVAGGSGLTAEVGVESTALYDKLYIRRNELLSTAGAGDVTINVGLASNTSAFVGLAIVDDNEVISSLTNGSIGIEVKLLSGSPSNGKSFVRRNRIKGYTTGVFPRMHGQCVVEDNRMETVTIDVGDDSTMSEIAKNRNRVAAGLTPSGTG